MRISKASKSISIEKVSGSSTEIDAFSVESRSTESPLSTRTASCVSINPTWEVIAMDAPAMEVNDEWVV